ncbi:RagB/SusD family nutrient uptake outer membrane protein [Chitinophaga defluvii]|uniref:RagB/SusD family nutrient uptake outer membrane protein n=1 Tax=Chitinophaga defluvii TaxID=3163343 RepID=A0ABV2T6P4_9BACT
MRRITYFILSAVMVCSTISCQKFLYVEPIDRLSSTAFWKSESDVRAAVGNCYALLLDKLGKEGTIYITAGDVRAGWVAYDNLTKNNLYKLAIAPNKLKDIGAYPDNWNLKGILNWKGFYKVIAACNVAIANIPEIPDNIMSKTIRDQYVGEALFVRAFTYFYLVKLYGDVIYTTDPVDPTPKPRENFMVVLDKCIADMEEAAAHLPWAYNDPTDRAVRASKGAALTVMAHMNMWKAGFDPANKESYWNKAEAATREIVEKGVYKLLPMDKDEFHAIFKGKSEEGVFEFNLDKNYNESLRFATFANWMLHDPYYFYSTSDWFHSVKFFKQFYGEDISGNPDKRMRNWFYKPELGNVETMFLKYSNVIDKNNFIFDDNLIIYRYPDVLLLRAEVLNNLGKAPEAILLLNMVRERSNAVAYPNDPKDNERPLGDIILKERIRELVGEGHIWFDLVRTGKVMDGYFTEYPMSKSDFDAGAWTWPIPAENGIQNPYFKSNEFWNN